MRYEGHAFVALTSLPAPRCRIRQPEIEPAAPRSPNQDSLPGWSMQQAVQNRGRIPLMAEPGPTMIPVV